MSKQKKEKDTSKKVEEQHRKALIADINWPSNKYQYSRISIASDTDESLWGYFELPGHQVRISIVTSYCGNTWNGSGKVMMTVRANADRDSALTKYFESRDPEELVAKFEEYKAFAETIPETTNWRWYVERGFVDGDF